MMLISKNILKIPKYLLLNRKYIHSQNALHDFMSISRSNKIIKWNKSAIILTPIIGTIGGVCIYSYIKKSSNIQSTELSEEQHQINIKYVQQNGLFLQFMKVQTEEMCINAVRQNGMALEFVKEQTSEICLIAVRQNGMALKFVRKQTTEICMEAVKQNWKAFEYVKEQTAEICMEVVIGSINRKN